MIVFESVRFRSFMSYGQYWTEIKLNSSPRTLIVGLNGVGKTTVIEALSFGLYKRAFRNINLPQLINSTNGKGTLVEVIFTIGPDRFKVVRGMKPNIFEIYKNDNLIPQNDKSLDYQRLLEDKILRLSHRAFCQIVVLGSKSYIPFLELSAAHRREVVEGLLELEVYSKMAGLHREETERLEKELAEVVYRRKVLDEKITLQRRHVERLKQNNQEIIDAKIAQIAEAGERVEKDEAESRTLAKAIAEAEERLRELAEVEGRITRLRRLETKTKAKQSELAKRIGFYHDNDECPTCLQSINTDFKCDVISDLNEEVEKYNATLDDVLAILNKDLEKQAELQKVSNERAKHLTRQHVLESNISHGKEQIKSLTKEIEELRNKAEEPQAVTENFEEERNALEKSYAELLQRQEMLRYASLILKDSGIKAKRIKQYMPTINKLINKYLADFELYIQFELDENFNESMKAANMENYSLGSFSEGEKLRINLAILFAWRDLAKMRNNASTNLLVMDEILDSSLDQPAKDDFMKIVYQLTSGTNLFIISHSESFQDKFENVLWFEKHQRFSRLASQSA